MKGSVSSFCIIADASSKLHSGIQYNAHVLIKRRVLIANDKKESKEELELVS